MDNDQVQLEIFLNNIKGLENRLENLERQTQPQIIDWYSLIPSAISRISNYKIRVADLPRELFSVGDKIRLKQTGDSDFRYFYVSKTIDVSSGIFDIELGYGRPEYLTGSDSFVDALAITEIAVSKAVSPSGMGGTLFFDTTFKNPAGGTLSTTSKLTQYSLNGNVFFMNISAAFSATVTAAYIKFNIPIDIDLTYSAGGASRMSILTSGGGGGPNDTWLNLDRNTTQPANEVWLRPYAPFAANFTDLSNLDTTVSMVIDNS